MFIFNRLYIYMVQKVAMRRFYPCPPVPPSSFSQRQPGHQVLGCPLRALCAFAHYLLVLSLEDILMYMAVNFTQKTLCSVFFYNIHFFP